MRTFELVPFGKPAPEDAVACDGLVSGAALDVSHWKGSSTPAELRADTSVEMALRLAESDRKERWKLVTNNHFDTDGVLAVFCLLHPEIALAHRSVVIGAAEVGDFDEWPADERGLMLDAAIARLARLKGEARAYETVLDALPTLVPQIETREDLWGEGMRELREATTDLAVSSVGPIAILHHRGPELPGPILSKRAPSASRWLLAFEKDDGTFDYRYEMRRWSWAETVVRPRLASPSRNAIVQKLEGSWRIKGDLGMTGLLHGERIRMRPDEVAPRILEGDKQAA